jgi:hypothetical protein
VSRSNEFHSAFKLNLFAAEYIDTMGNALSARLAAIQSEAERLQALQASAERKAREGLLLQRTSDAEHLQQRQEYFIDMISHEVRVRPSDERHRVELKTALRD